MKRLIVGLAAIAVLAASPAFAALKAGDKAPDFTAPGALAGKDFTFTLSKALTGGTLPLSAAVASTRVFEAFLSDDPEAALMHGPTYMANPLACAAANASLDLFESEPRLEQVAAIETHLRNALEPCRALPGVIDVRAKGAIGVVQVDTLTRVEWLKQRFVEEGVWIRPFGDIIYVMPPFVIELDDLTHLTNAMVKVIGEWSILQGVNVGI